MSKLKQVNIRVTEQQLQIILDGYAKSKFQTQRDYVLSLISAGLKLERARGAITPKQATSSVLSPIATSSSARVIAPTNHDNDDLLDIFDN